MNNGIMSLLDEESITSIDIDGQEVTYADDIVALDSYTRGINSAMESITQIARLKTIFAKRRDAGVSPITLKIGRLVLENAQTHLSIVSNNKFVALEEIKEDPASCEAACDIALESFSGFIHKVWKAIVKAFRYIWEKITALFKEEKTKKLRAQAKATHADVKDILKAIRDGRIVTDDLGDVNEAYFLIPVAFLGDKVTDKDLLTFLDRQSIVIDRIRVTSNKLLELSILLEEEVHQLKSHGFSEERAMRIGGVIRGYFEDFVTRLDKEHTNPLEPRMLAEQFGVEKRFIDSATVHSMDGFLFGSKYYVFGVKDDETDLLRWLGYFDNHGGQQHSYTAMKIIGPENIDLYQSKVVSMVGDLSFLEEDFNHGYQTLRLRQGSLVAEIETILMELSKKDAQDISVAFMKVIQQLMNSLMMLTKDLSILMVQSQATSLYFVRLGAYFAKRYQDSTPK